MAVDLTVYFYCTKFESSKHNGLSSKMLQACCRFKLIYLQNLQLSNLYIHHMFANLYPC